MAEVGFVNDFHVRQRPSVVFLQRLAIDGRRQQLLEGLQTIEETSAIGRSDFHARGVDVQSVSLVFERLVGHHRDGAGCRSGVHLKVDAQRALGLTGKFAGIAQRSVARCHDTVDFREAQRAVALSHTGRIRHQREHLAHLFKILLAHEGERLVGIRAVVPESEFFTRSGTTPLVHIHAQISLRRNHEIARIVGISRGLPNEIFVGVRRFSGLEHTFLLSRSSIEREARTACKGIARRCRPFDFPELCVTSHRNARKHFFAVALRREHTFPVRHLNEIPCHVVADAYLRLFCRPQLRNGKQAEEA